MFVFKNTLPLGYIRGSWSSSTVKLYSDYSWAVVGQIFPFVLVLLVRTVIRAARSVVDVTCACPCVWATTVFYEQFVDQCHAYGTSSNIRVIETSRMWTPS